MFGFDRVYPQRGRFTVFLSVAFCVVFTSSCIIPSGPTDEGPAFHLQVSVRDRNNNAVAGLRVSAWNLIRLPGLSKARGRAESGVLSTATLGYALPVQSSVQLLLSELNGTVLDTLVEGEYPAGIYRVALSVHLNAGCRVLKCTLRAGVFRDSLYAVLWQPDPASSVLGYTSSMGIVVATDPLSFPNVFDLPAMVFTSNEGPEALGTFTIPASVAICLVDTAADLSQTYRVDIHRGENDVTLPWNAPQPLSRGVSVDYPVLTKRIYSDSTTIVVPKTYALYQSYPNPFN
ncbi:MAG TPA: hypothetical protein VLY03_05380 [Bacteroidota bacterium]|nr:hypothetical protein [Bacteroidota bacterium]